jgi:hypothetical protein
MATTFTPYTTAADLFGPKPQWVPMVLDQERLLSYMLYEQIYWNVPDVFKVSLRGSNTLPVYVPSGRTIVDTTHRFTAVGFGVTTRDRTSGASDTTDAVAARMALQDLMRRERFKSKFNANKRYCIMRGDAVWHITADPTKPLGSRLTITALDPGMYFPVTDENDVDRIVGVHLVEHIETADGPRIRRLTYMKTENGQIEVSEGLFEVDVWGKPDATPRSVIRAAELLPPSITALPVYHFKNFEEPGNPFGSSELRGLERLMSAVNQTMSDEDLALALQGIGMYATDGSKPTDKQGNEVPWQLGPGRVVHTDGSFFNRVPGVSGLSDSYGTHYDRLWEAIKQASGTPDIAIGRVDVSVAESGIALALQLGPCCPRWARRMTSW